MYYIPELLKRRNSGYLSRCWLAATLSETQFRKIYKPRQLIEIDVEKLSNDIIKGTRTNEFSLYLSSQLMAGVVKLQLYKTIALEASCKQLQADMMPKILAPKGKKRKDNPLDLPDVTAEVREPPPFPEQFMIDLQQPDRNLIVEIDASLGRMGYDHRFQDAGDDFGDREFDRLNDNSLAALSRGDGLFEELNDRNIDPDDGTAHAENIPERYPMANLNLNEEALRTPTKKARRTLADTPSKLRRRMLFESLENQENIPPTDDPMNTSPCFPTTVNPPIIQEKYQLTPTIHDNLAEIQPVQDDAPRDLVTEIPSADKSQAHSPTDSSDLIFGPLSQVETLPQRRMKRTKFLDVLTRIPCDDLKKQIADLRFMTRNKSRVDIDRTHLESESLFNRPSTSRRFKSNFMWANELHRRFLDHIQGPFEVDNDESMFPESVRVRDATEVTAELSDDIDQRRRLVSEQRHRKAADTASRLVDEEIPFAEITNDPIDFESAEIPDHPSVESVLGALSEDQSSMTLAAVAPIEEPLQPVTRRNIPRPSIAEQEVPRRQYRSSSEDNTIDINNMPTPLSSNLNSPFIPLLQSKKKLHDELRKRWDEKLQLYPVEFAEVFPRETTLKSVATCGILDLMHLATDGEVSIQQEKSNGPVFIYLDLD